MKTTKTKLPPHTPTPWRAYKTPSGRRRIEAEDPEFGGLVCVAVSAAYGENAYAEIRSEMIEGNFELIVRAVNSHAQLVAACERALSYIDGFTAQASGKPDARTQIRAALTSAKGTP